MTLSAARSGWGDDPDELRFDQADRELVGAGFRLPYESASAEGCARVPATPPVQPGGLRADETRDFRLEVTTELCRAPGDTVLTCLRDLDVLDEPLEARIGIAPDVALLIQHDTIVGWSLTDPARYLTTGFAAPDPNPLKNRNPATLGRLRALDRALRNQHEDRHRADALLALIGKLVEDYADRPAGQKP
ncbi:hypothetical protein ABT063_34785 [Streptomyces sp. NPDC002838]|uniref:hypothetical protein n=1 Tax=Streptomyces sp. NPDC002838 TaxID=3154436 RepID=UPI003332251E